MVPDTQSGARGRKPATDERPADIAAFLRAQGLRVTAQRLLILEALRDAPGHVTAEEVYQKVADRLPALSIVSVYRTLEFFAQRGMLTRTSLGERATQWEWHAGAEHHHLICRSCGHRQDIDDALFAEAAARLQHEYGFHAELRHMAVWGTCGPCWEHQTVVKE
jgi:Fur family transcriptional regulator, ferric uptake regulator